MSRGFQRLLAQSTVCALLVTAMSSPSRGGQHRIDVGPGATTTFSPSSKNLNIGDQVVWVWLTGTHSVTSGSPCSSSPIFNSGTLPGARFSWKSDRTGAVPYFCVPHCPDMTGSLNISGGSFPASEFRITEVYLGSATDSQFVEIANLGGEPGNLGVYRLSFASGTATILPLVNISVLIAGRVIVHLNQSGTNSETDLFLPGLRLARTGSAALYLPNTVNTSLADPNMMVDFVQWGAGGQPNEGTAASANYWTSGEFVSTPGTGRTMEFCGSAVDRGQASWLGVVAPSPGSSDCVNPTRASSWGRLKTLYR